MPQMGRCRLRRRFCPDEALRGQSHSRRHSQACVQNTPDKARNVHFVDVCCNALSAGLAAGTEVGLRDLRRSYGVEGFVTPYRTRRSRSIRDP